MKKKWKTFNEWSDQGHKILKGEKSTKRNKKGECLFSDQQVGHQYGSHILSGLDDDQDEMNDPFLYT